MKIKLSQSDWEEIGVKMGWLKEASKFNQFGGLDQIGVITNAGRTEPRFPDAGIDDKLKVNAFDEKFFGGLPKGAREEIMPLKKMLGELKGKSRGMPEGSPEADKIAMKIERIEGMISDIVRRHRKPAEGGPGSEGMEGEARWEKGNEEGFLRGQGLQP
jgi:hypothetical protein